MLFRTHILLGMALFLITKDFFVGGNIVLFLLLVLVGSIFPDIDEPHSKMHQWSGPFGEWVTAWFSHRGLFHALILHLGLFALMGHFVGLYYARGLFLGYVAHIVGDGITPMGVRIFYPFSDFKFRGPIKVGGALEWILFVVLFVLVVRGLV